MNASGSANSFGGITLRQAALIGGFSLLVMSCAAPFAQLFVFPRLVDSDNIEQTVRNIAAQQGLFLAAIFGYLVSFICDLVLSWALYVLLSPVNRSLSLLMAWFRLVYTCVGIFGIFKLLNVYHLVTMPEYLALFGAMQRNGQVKLLLDSYQYEWSIGLVLFAIHLCLLGYLVYRSGYIPRILGILLAIDGLAWLVNCLRPYLYPNAHLGFLFYIFFAELIFMLWLLIRGWKIREPEWRS